MNSLPRSVLPVPGPPHTRVGRPWGRPLRNLVETANPARGFRKNVARTGARRTLSWHDDGSISSVVLSIDMTCLECQSAIACRNPASAWLQKATATTVDLRTSMR
jgi:hypothetical protein